MTEAVTALEKLGTQVILLADNPTPPEQKVYDCVAKNPDDYLACGFLIEGNKLGKGTEPPEDLRAETGVDYPDLNARICPTGGEECPAVSDDTMIYPKGTPITAS